MNRVYRGIRQLHRAYRKKRDDRGSAIVIVIIAMAMIGILATTLLWMAYMNYMIKVADIRNKNSFYSAEEVVEQIMAGLRQTSAEAVGVAYRDVLAGWDQSGGEGARYSEFATTYMDTLLDKLKDDSLGTGYYDRDKLKAFVDADIFLESSPNEGVDADAWKHGDKLSEPERRPQMEIVNNNSIILHNLYVSYTDSENRVSIVQTDICLDVPKLIFENGGSIDALYEYSLIGNEGIEVMGSAGTVAVEGSIYAGASALRADGGLRVNSASTLALSDSRRVISKEDIIVKGPAAGLVVRDMPGEDNRVYARNIMLDSGTVSLDSKTYVANDLSLNGSGSKVTLTKDYYGYGYSTYNGLPGEAAGSIDSGASSAIIINGKSSTVDLERVNRLLLAGRSYIGQASTQAEAEFNKAQIEAGLLAPSDPVLMGESIAVKGGQIAYLVPAECIGVVNGESVIGQNPINGDKVNDIMDMETEYGADFKEVDFNRQVYRLGNKSLSEFGVTGMDHIRKVNVQYNGSTLRYYYLVMDKHNAERYFVQYYDFHGNREAIDKYFDKYVAGGIVLGDFETADNSSDNQYKILGNSLVSSALSESGVTLLTSVDQTSLNSPEGEGGSGEGENPDGEGNPGGEVVPDPDAYTETGENAQEVINKKEETDVMALSEEIAGVYKALNFNLTEDASTVPSDPEIAKNYYVFNGVIKETEVVQYLDDNHKNTVVYKTDSGDLQAVLTKGNPDENGKRRVTLSGLLGSKCADTRLVIALCDVIVDDNFTGLIIAKGKITVNPGVNYVKRDKMGLYKVLEAKGDIEGNTITPIDMFVNGSGSMLNGAESADVDDAGNLVIDYGEIVRYMNWIKK